MYIYFLTKRINLVSEGMYMKLMSYVPSFFIIEGAHRSFNSCKINFFMCDLNSHHFNFYSKKFRVSTAKHSNYVVLAIYILHLLCYRKNYLNLFKFLHDCIFFSILDKNSIYI